MEEQALTERAESLADLTHHIAYKLRATSPRGHAEGQISSDGAFIAAATIVAAAVGHEHG
jgi:hypothetical protein